MKVNICTVYASSACKKSLNCHSALIIILLMKLAFFMVLTVQNLQKLKVVKVMLTSLLPHTIYKYRLKIHFHKQNHHCGYIYTHTKLAVEQ